MSALNHVIIFLLAVTIRGGAGDVISDCAGKPADVIFVLDASNSIWRPDFQRQLSFIKSVVEFFTVGTANTMVGVITYARHPQLQFQLNYYNRKSDLFAAIDNIRQDGGYETRTSEALRYLRERGFSESRGARSEVAKVAVIITDGRSDNATLSALEAYKVKAEGVHLFAVGVGRNLDMEELKTLASEPTDHYTFLVDNYHGLERIKDLLAIKTCAVTDPPSTTTTTTTATTTTTTPSTTTISTTATPTTRRRQRRVKTTRQHIIATTTTTTTLEQTTMSATLKSTDNNDDDDDDTDGSKIKGGITDPDTDSDDNRRISGIESSLSEELSPSAIKSGSTGHESVGSSDRIIGNNHQSHRSGNREWNSFEGEEGEEGQASSEFESGRELTEGGELSEHRRRTTYEEEQRIAGGGGGGKTFDLEDGEGGGPDRRTVRTPEILEAPIYVQESTQYPYHELVAQQLRNNPEAKNPERPRTSEHERGTEDELEIHRSSAPSSGSSGGSTEEGERSGYGSSRYTELGIYSFDSDNRFVRQEGSESLVDEDRLPKVPEDGYLVLEEGDRIVSVDTSGQLHVVGYVVNGTHYIGTWMEEDDGKSSIHGYRAPSEITDRIRDDTTRSHVIDPPIPGGNGADGNLADVDNDLDSLYTDYHGGSEPRIHARRRNPPKAVNEEDDEEEEDRESEMEVLDPYGRPGYWNEGEDGEMVWYLYTCPGVYVPVPDVQLDENGKPMVNGHSQCGERTGDGAEYVYVSPGHFEKVVPTSGPGVPGERSEPDDESRYQGLSSKEETSVWDDGRGSDMERGDVERTGIWTIDVDGSLRPIQGELVDLDLPKIEEDQEFYVKDNIIWTKDGSDKLKPVGCIINGTYYVGYWIRKDDGTQMLYGYPSKDLERKLSREKHPPAELAHLSPRLRESLPAAEAAEGGQWAFDEHGVLSWYARIADDTPDDRQEFKVGGRIGHGHMEAEPDQTTPDRDDVLESKANSPENGDKSGRKIVVDSDGRSGSWRPGEEGQWVWHRYVCPGIYVPVPEVPAPEDEVPPSECTAKDENGVEAKFEYESPGKFKKVPKEQDTRNKNDIDTIDTRDGDSKDNRNSDGPDGEEEEEGDETERRSLQVPGSEDFNNRATLEPFQIDTPVTERIASLSPKSHKEKTNKTNGKSPSQKGCRPRKPTDLAFIIDSKHGDEASLDRMWNLTAEILQKLDLEAGDGGTDGDRMIRIRFVQECGSGTAGLDLGEFESKETLVNALDAIIDTAGLPQPTSPAQLITNMAEALSRDDAEADDSHGRRRRRLGVYVTDGTSAAAMEETVEAAQRAKHDAGVEMFTVGVGHRTSPTELRAVASCDVARHYYAMNHHSKADAVAKKIAKVICLGR